MSVMSHLIFKTLAYKIPHGSVITFFFKTTKQPMQQQEQRLRVVTLCKWGVGNELVAIFQNDSLSWDESKRGAKAKTLVFDRIPSSSAAFAGLHQFGKEKLFPDDQSTKFSTDKSQLLRISQELRSKLQQAIATTGVYDDEEDGDVQVRSEMERGHDFEWTQNITSVLSCWRALEIQFLDRSATVRKLVVS